MLLKYLSLNINTKIEFLIFFVILIAFCYELNDKIFIWWLYFQKHIVHIRWYKHHVKHINYLLKHYLIFLKTNFMLNYFSSLNMDLKTMIESSFEISYITRIYFPCYKVVIIFEPNVIVSNMQVWNAFISIQQYLQSKNNKFSWHSIGTKICSIFSLLVLSSSFHKTILIFSQWEISKWIFFISFHNVWTCDINMLY